MNKNNKNPLVSICIPVYNGEKELSRAIESCICQTYSNLEIIISDDGSTDKTSEIVKKYAIKDKRIKYVKSDTNSGAVKNFLKAVNSASGEFVQILNHDDWLSNNYAEEGVKKFNLYPEAAAIIPKSIFVDEKLIGNKRIFELNSKVSFKPEILKTEYIVRNFYKIDFGSIFTLSFIRKNDLKEGLYYLNKIIINKDNDEISRETKNYLKIGWGMDVITPLHILTKYDFTVTTEESVYVKMEQTANLGKAVKFDYKTIIGVVGYPDYMLNCLLHVYRQYWLKYMQGMKYFVGAQTINSVILGFFKNNLRLDYFKGTKKVMKKFFGAYSLFEKICVITIFTPILMVRSIKVVKRKLSPPRYPEKSICKPELFLDNNCSFNAFSNN